MPRARRRGGLRNDTHVRTVYRPRAAHAHTHAHTHTHTHARTHSRTHRRARSHRVSRCTHAHTHTRTHTHAHAHADSHVRAVYLARCTLTLSARLHAWRAGIAVARLASIAGRVAACWPVSVARQARGPGVLSFDGPEAEGHRVAGGPRCIMMSARGPGRALPVAVGAAQREVLANPGRALLTPGLRRT